MAPLRMLVSAEFTALFGDPEAPRDSEAVAPLRLQPRFVFHARAVEVAQRIEALRRTEDVDTVGVFYFVALHSMIRGIVKLGTHMGLQRMSSALAHKSLAMMLPKTDLNDLLISLGAAGYAVLADLTHGAVLELLCGNLDEAAVRSWLQAQTREELELDMGKVMADLRSIILAEVRAMVRQPKSYQIMTSKSLGVVEGMGTGMFRRFVVVESRSPTAVLNSHMGISVLRGGTFGFAYEGSTLQSLQDGLNSVNSLFGGQQFELRPVEGGAVPVPVGAAR